MMDAESPPWRRGRTIVVALLVLLLILLPLYLWPLRGALSGLPGASWLPGSLRDPRSPAAVARIPSEVWEALMGRAAAPPPLPAASPSRNLTMISEFEPTTDEGLASPLAREMIAELGPSAPSGDPSGWNSGGDDSPPTSIPWLASNPVGAPGTGNSWPRFGPGGHPSIDGLGPWQGGGPGGEPRFTTPPTFDPGGPGAPTPTPEPATLVLVGSNLVLLGAAAWKRRRQRLETIPPIG
ncbi:MAG: PEP-CTERM sorting domain-containing protein [Candidatus Rokuibacteriota bacterium]